MSSFYARRSQKCKKLLNLTVFFALLGSAHVKATCKHVDEIDPLSDCNLPLTMFLREYKVTQNDAKWRVDNFLSLFTFGKWFSFEKTIFKFLILIFVLIFKSWQKCLKASLKTVVLFWPEQRNLIWMNFNYYWKEFYWCEFFSRIRRYNKHHSSFGSQRIALLHKCSRLWQYHFYNVHIYLR